MQTPNPFIRKVRRQDRIATRIISLGGFLVIASVIAILLLIIRVTAPLFQSAQSRLIQEFPLPNTTASALAVGIDDTQEIAYTLDNKGLFTFYATKQKSVLQSLPASSSQTIAITAISTHKNNQYTLLAEDGSINLVDVLFQMQFDQAGKRTIQPNIATKSQFPALPAVTVSKAIARHDEGGTTTLVSLTDNGHFHISRQVVTTDLFDNEKKEEFGFAIAEEIPGKITTFTVDEKGSVLYAGTDSGNLLRWDISANDKAVRTDNVIASSEKVAITAVELVFGDISVAVGDAAGKLSTWSLVKNQEGSGNTKKLRKIHTLKPHSSPVAHIITSRRTKTIISTDSSGLVHYDYMTSEKHLLEMKQPLTRFAIADSDRSLIGLNNDGHLLIWDISNPHPEISLKTLFGKVWYESYDQPEFVWHSSAGNDDFEPKFSIVPLLFGTIKGTLYAMLFAIPLSILGAVYTSQFTSYGFKKAIKPMIEIMASVPSVVIGFLIALWLGPVIEASFLPLLICTILLPLVLILLMTIMMPYYRTPTLKNRCAGYEFLLLAPVVLGVFGLSAGIAPLIENAWFSGNFLQWLYTEGGIRYDQRNSIIIAFGLGIAVIPIIFSITEDAISNIPNSLTGASLALGASRWQTIWRVVLPSASPGIFAAIMIGFGRAVGETMIVLMATGNTPIMDWSIFNGMRTLAANIAVEIPEAPFNGTLYRVLFLCATLLFSLTFILNTGAEIVRERLRKKYGRY
jgi:phosphate transport system permease protein